MIAAGVIAASIYELSSPFISLWLGEQYVLAKGVVLLISIEYFLGILRLCTDQFIQGSGLFSDIWSPVAEVSILIIVSVFFGSVWGLKGVLLGPILSAFIIIYLWKPYFLFTRGLKISIYHYWLILFKNFVAFACSYFAASSLCSCILPSLSLSWGAWLIKSALFAFFLLFFSTTFISFVSPSFKSLLLDFKQKIYNSVFSRK